MRITIFGATGRVGSHIVKLAMADGHEVVVMVRKKSTMKTEGDSLKIIEGALDNDLLVSRACEGAEAVISAMGGPYDEPLEQARHRATQLVGAMKAVSARRIIAIGGAGILQATEITMVKETPSYPAQFKHVAEVHLQTFEILNASGLDWTLMCPPTIVEKELTKIFRIRKNFSPENTVKIGTSDLAYFMLQQASKQDLLAARVGISY